MRQRHVSRPKRCKAAKHAEIARDHVAALDADERGDFALFVSFANALRGRYEREIARMLANLLVHSFNLSERAFYRLWPRDFAGNPNGKEDRPKAALLHTWDVDAPQRISRAQVESSVQKTLRGVVVRVDHDGREMELLCAFRNSVHSHCPRQCHSRRKTHPGPEKRFRYS